MKITTTKKARRVPITLTMTLSWEEAVVLRSICTAIGGSPTGPRAVTDSIDIALANEGISDDGATDGFLTLPDGYEDFLKTVED